MQVQYSGYQCITPLLQPVAGFDPATSLKPLGHLIDAPQLLVRADFPADTFADFLKYVKANPAKVNYASSGNGSLQHVTTELLKDLTKTLALMVTGRTRLAALPNVPTATEAGVPLVATSWFAVYGPNSLSADLQGRLSQAIRQVVESENFKNRAEDQGAKAVAMDGPELAALGASERNMWSRVVKLANIKAD